MFFILRSLDEIRAIRRFCLITDGNDFKYFEAFFKTHEKGFPNFNEFLESYKKLNYLFILKKILALII